MKNTLKRALTILTALVIFAVLALPVNAFAAADGSNRDTDVTAEVEVNYDISFVDENGLIPPLTDDAVIGSLQNGEDTLLEEDDLLDITLDSTGILTNGNGDTLTYTVSIDGPGVIDPDTGEVKYPVHVVVDWTGAVIGTTYTSDVTVTVRERGADPADPPIFEHTVTISSFISPMEVVKLDAEIINSHFGNVTLNSGSVADGDSFLFLKNTAVTFRITPTGTNKLVSLKFNGVELPRSAWSKIGSTYIVTLTGLSENSVFTVQFEDQNSPLPPLTGVGSLIGWLILVIIAFLLAAGAYIWYRNEKKKKRIADMEQGEALPEPDAIPAEQPKVDNTPAEEEQPKADDTPVKEEPAEQPKADDLHTEEAPSTESTADAEAPAEPSGDTANGSTSSDDGSSASEVTDSASDSSAETADEPVDGSDPAEEVDNTEAANEQPENASNESEELSDDTIDSAPYLDEVTDADETH